MANSLKDRVAEKRAEESTLRRNPEVDAKLDQFIADNPRLLESYQRLSKDELIRKLMLRKMNQREVRQGRNAEILAWVDENPDIKARIEAQVKNVPEANRQRAFVNAARLEAQQQGMRAPRMSA